MVQCFKVGDRVSVRGYPAYYNPTPGEVFPENRNGTVMSVRCRYVGTSNEQTQYRVCIDGEQLGDNDLDYLFEEYKCTPL
jgi:hypothetical protein